MADVRCRVRESRGAVALRHREDTIVASLDYADDLDRYIAHQPEVVRDAAADAEEYFRLLRSLASSRKDSRIRQKDAALAMGTTQSAVSELEGGRTDPQVSTLMRYARAVGCRVRLVAGAEDVMKPASQAAWQSTVRRRAAPRIHREHRRIVEEPGAVRWRRSA